jgi:hypothetical protein
MAAIACHPCDTIFTRIVGEETNLGLAALDVGGNFVLQDSISRRNHIGLAFGNPDHEGPPPTGALIRRNLIVDNNNRAAPAVETTASSAGVGMLLLGGREHTVEHNDVRNHELAGVALMGNPWIPQHPATGHIVRDNRVSGSGLADLVQDLLAGRDNCWSGNTYSTTQPPALEMAWSCDLPTPPPGGVPAFAATFLPEQSSAGDWRTWPAPSDPSAWRDQPDDDGDGRYRDDGAVDRWLPELTRVVHAPRTTPAPAPTTRSADEMAATLLAGVEAALQR